MGDLEKTYSKFAAAQSKATATVTAFIKEFFPYLILLLNIGVTIISPLFIAEAQNPFTVEFFISLGNNLLSTMFCYACFIGYGERSTYALMPSYEHNKKRWSELSAKVRINSDAFVAYCSAQSEQERDDLRKAIITNNTLLSIDEYEARYKKCSWAQLKILVRQGVISKMEAKCIHKANTLAVRPIKPLLILCGVQFKHLNEAGRDDKMNYSTLSVISRPLIVFVTNSLVSMISGKWLGFTDASVLYEMVSVTLLIIISSVLGYSAGAESARREHDKIKARIFFLEKYEQINQI